MLKSVINMLSSSSQTSTLAKAEVWLRADTRSGWGPLHSTHPTENFFALYLTCMMILNPFNLLFIYLRVILQPTRPQLDWSWAGSGFGKSPVNLPRLFHPLQSYQAKLMFQILSSSTSWTNHLISIVKKFSSAVNSWQTAVKLDLKFTLKTPLKWT